MVTLNNKHTLTISITAGNRAWAFPTSHDLWLYLVCHIHRSIHQPNKIDIVFNQTKRVTMRYEDMPEPINKTFAYSIIDPPLNHPKYGLIAAWGFWVHH